MKSKEGKILELREALLIKRSHRNLAFFIRPEVDAKFLNETEAKKEEEASKNTSFFISNTFKEPLFFHAQNSPARKALFQCKGVQILSDRIILWSDRHIFHGRLDRVNSVNSELGMKLLAFAIPKNEGVIDTVLGKGPEQNPDDYDKYYLIIKIQLSEINSSYIIRYNLKKEKEFSAFDCSEKAEVFFDYKQNAFILDEECIIDMQSGLNMQFFKARLEHFNRKLNICNLEVGNRFSVDMEHFLIRGTVYLPYTYFSLTCYSK